MEGTFAKELQKEANAKRRMAIRGTKKSGTLCFGALAKCFGYFLLCENLLIWMASFHNMRNLYYVDNVCHRQNVSGFQNKRALGKVDLLCDICCTSTRPTPFMGLSTSVLKEIRSSTP